jgi:hypothetical protein
LIDTALNKTLPPRGNPGYLQVIFQSLIESKPGGETSLAEALKQTAAAIRHRGLVILVSDCFDDVDGLVKALGLFRRDGHEVIVFQIWDPDELDFPFRQRTQFCCLESDRQRTLDARAVQAAYLARVTEFRQKLETEFAKEHIELVVCRTNQNCGEILADFLGSRRRLQRRASGAGRRPGIKVER